MAVVSPRFFRYMRPFLFRKNGPQHKCHDGHCFAPQGRCMHTSPPTRSSDPFRQMEHLMRDMERKMRHTFGQLRPFGTPFRDPWGCRDGVNIGPKDFYFGNALDVSEGSTYKLKFDCMEAKPEDIKVTLKENIITVKIEYSKEGSGSKVVHSMEHQISVPEGVDTDRLESSLSAHGDLTIYAPRVTPDGPQNIEIKRE